MTARHRRPLITRVIETFDGWWDQADARQPLYLTDENDGWQGKTEPRDPQDPVAGWWLEMRRGFARRARGHKRLGGKP